MSENSAKTAEGFKYLGIHGRAMRLVNTTPIASETLREVVRIARPPGVSRFKITFKRSSRGVRAYRYGGSVITVKAPFPLLARDTLAIRGAPRRGYLDLGHFRDDLEVLVAFGAHELRHEWQAQGSAPRRGMVWGARGRFSERDADAWALSRVRLWRRLHPLDGWGPLAWEAA